MLRLDAAPSLLKLQRAFKKTITEAKGLKKEIIIELCPFVKQSSSFSTRDRLHVYSYAYITRLIEALEKDFAVFAKIIGTKAFKNLSVQYFEAHPSIHFSIAEASRAFAAFVKKNKTYRRRPALVSLVEFEWRLITSFYSLSADAFDPQGDLLKVKLRLHPSVEIFEHQFPIAELWLSKNPARKFAAIKKKTNNHCMIYRAADGFVRVIVLKKLQYETLKLLNGKNNLQTVCDRLSKKVRPTELKSLTLWFSELAAKGVLCR